MRIVLDSNILARVVMSPQGPAGALFDLVAADHLLIVSFEMLAELSRVLTYDRVRRVHQLEDRGIEEFVKRVEAGALVVRLPAQIPPVVPDDQDDDVLIATAVAGKADFVCTRNRHLFADAVIAHCRVHDIEILDDLMLLQALRGNV